MCTLCMCVVIMHVYICVCLHVRVNGWTCMCAYCMFLLCVHVVWFAPTIMLPWRFEHMEGIPTTTTMYSTYYHSHSPNGIIIHSISSWRKSLLTQSESSCYSFNLHHSKESLLTQSQSSCVIHSISCGGIPANTVTVPAVLFIQFPRGGISLLTQSQSSCVIHSIYSWKNPC